MNDFFQKQAIHIAIDEESSFQVALNCSHSCISIQGFEVLKICITVLNDFAKLHLYKRTVKLTVSLNTPSCPKT